MSVNLSYMKFYMENKFFCFFLFNFFFGGRWGWLNNIFRTTSNIYLFILKSEKLLPCILKPIAFVNLTLKRENINFYNL